MREDEYTALRTLKQTHRKLRLIAAHQNEKIIETLDRLATEELQRIGIKIEDGIAASCDQAAI